MTYSKVWLVPLAAIGVIAISIASPTSAIAQECYRPTDCDDDDVCLENICSPSPEPLEECGPGDGCDGNKEICDDGYCKVDAVYCENPAGHGYSENEWSACFCGTGMASESFTEEPPDPPLTDEELFEECMDNLVSMCGEEAPDISDECTDEQLATCTDLLEHVNALLEACGEEAEDIGYAALADCCEEVAEEDEEFEAYSECIMGLEPADCAQMDDCWDDSGESAGDDDLDGAGDGENTTEDEGEGESKDGGSCSLSPASRAWTSHLIGAIVLSMI